MFFYQQLFKMLTTNTTEFTDCFEDDSPLESQAAKWRKVLNTFFQKSFKKVRISNKPKKDNSILNVLLKRRTNLKKKTNKDENYDDEMMNLETLIAEECQEENRKKVIQNFKDINGSEGNLQHQGVWKAKKRYFPKLKPKIPVGKKNVKGQMITNPQELKELYLSTFKHRLRHRPAAPGYEDLLDKQEELFKHRLELAKMEKTPPWKMSDLEKALKSLKTDKCRDPEGIIREIFKDEVIGTNLKKSLLILYNKVKQTGIIPVFMRFANIAAIYKGKGEMTSLDSDRGIFLVTIFRTILMKMLYSDKYEIIDGSMSDSNIGARKRKNIRNHIFIVNSILHDVLSKKSNQSVDIMILDYKQMFDSECLYECLNDVYEAGVIDDKFVLLYEANRENLVAVQTPNGISRRELIQEVVMQGDVLAPLISSLQVDTMGKECLEDGKHLYYYKNTVPIPPLGLVDDLFTISECGYKTTMMNQFINSKTAMKKLQFGTTKCFKLHVGKTCNKTLCKDLYVDGWKIDIVEDLETGESIQKESFVGPQKMKEKEEQIYLGDVISSDGKHAKNVSARKNKALGTIDQIMQILETVFFGKYHFEVAMILRSSLLLSSLLLNSEAWVNLSDQDIRSLEQTDEILLSKIVESSANTSNAFKYLELGIYPIRFEIMKRKIVYLHYLLQQEDTSMIYKVFQATQNHPVKNDFVQTCTKYLEQLEIDLTFDELAAMSQTKVKNLVKQKTHQAGFKYLIEKASSQNIAHIKYEDLSMQDYLLDGNVNTTISKVIFKARSMTLDIKMQRKWKYSDILCMGCGVNDETGQEILSCEGFSEKKENLENLEKTPLLYSKFYYGATKEMVYLAKVLSRKLKIRDKLKEEVPG